MYASQGIRDSGKAVRMPVDWAASDWAVPLTAKSMTVQSVRQVSNEQASSKHEFRRATDDNAS